MTGIGIVSPLGNRADDFHRNLMAGVSGVGRVSFEGADRLSVRIAAETTFDFESFFPKKQFGILDRTGQMALVSAAQAWDESGLAPDDSEKSRAGVYLGTGMGGARTVDSVSSQLYGQGAARVSPVSIIKVMANAPASHISIRYGLSGPCLTFSTACSSSAVAIGEAFRLIRSGGADFVLAGGTESMITYSSFKCWESLGVLAPEDPEGPGASCKPFAKDRMGLVIGEGAAVVVLEDMERARRRGAPIHAELAGYGVTSDAHHITGPSMEGQARAMRLALEDAACPPDAIGCINAHGTATELNDVIETRAIRQVFGASAARIPVSSTKSMHGHLMGAGGAVEFVAALLAIKHQSVHPTANLRIPDPECDLDYVPLVGRERQKVSAAMSNSFAFGGTNAVLVAKSA